MLGQHPKGFLNLLLLALCLGIVLAHSWAGGTAYMSVYGAMLVVTLLLGGVSLLRSHPWTWGLLLVAAALAGMLRFYVLTDISGSSVGALAGSQVRLTGVLDEAPSVSVDDEGKLHLKYVVAVEQVEDNMGEHAVKGKIVLYGNGNSLGSKILRKVDDGQENIDWRNVDELEFGQSGDTIKVTGKLRHFHDYGNPGRMQRDMTYASQGICAQMVADKYSIQLKENDSDVLARLAARIRSYYRDYMESLMPRQDAAAIFAMVFGGYQGIKQELLDAFTVTGIVHILSVSGSHITLMAGTAGIIGKLLHLPDKATAALATVTIIFYGLLAGAIPPVIRSAIMGILTLLALTMGRERDAQHILSITALGLLLYSPPLLYDISFQLSFGATAGLLYIAPILREKLRKKLPVFVADSLAITMAAQLSVLPVIAWYFNVISLSSLLANLVITPIVEWIIVMGLFAGLLASVIPVLGQLVFIVASMALGVVYELSRAVAALPASQIYMPTVQGGYLVAYYAGLLAWLAKYAYAERWEELKEKWLPKLKTWRNKILAGIGIMLACIVLFNWAQKGELQVHFIDVGQGDAALVITPHGHAFMVDTGGTRENGYDIGKMVDVPYLHHYGVRELDAIFLTHAHEDHAAGVKGILTKIPTKVVLIGHEGTGDYLKTFGRGEAGKTEKLLAPLKENTSLTLDGVKIEILYSPEAKEVANSNLNATGNEFSNLIRVSYGKASFLFTGDLISEQEAELLRRQVPLHSTVLKVGHHGSRTSSSEKFLQAVNPRWAVISCGFENSFGHPHKEVVERLKSATQAEIYRTDYNGAVVFKTDGETMRVESFRN